jgi:hypothetical protein
MQVDFLASHLFNSLILQLINWGDQLHHKPEDVKNGTISIRVKEMSRPAEKAGIGMILF